MKHVSALVGFGLALAGCSTPVPQLIIGLSGTGAQVCPSTDCRQVELLCPTAMSIRILDPDSGEPYLTQCTSVAIDGRQDMCSLASVDLGDVPIPVKHLEVQIALFPMSQVATDMTSHELICPDMPQFSSGTGFPIEQATPAGVSPALGGVGYYDPGDAKVTVTLGCTNLDAINSSCVAEDLISVNAQAYDFTKMMPVDAADATNLEVSIGEPQGVEDHYELPAGAQIMVPPQDPTDAGGAQWGGEISLRLTRYACAVVFDGHSRQATCRTVARPLGLRGGWIHQAQLDQIIDAIGSKGVPPGGLTVGMVLDASGKPKSGMTVATKTQGSATPSTVMYLDDGTEGKLVPGTTGTRGIFVSTDAPFGTEFSTSQGAGEPTWLGIGGNIQNVVTLVILSPTGN